MLPEASWPAHLRCSKLGRDVPSARATDVVTTAYDATPRFSAASAAARRTPADAGGLPGAAALAGLRREPTLRDAGRWRPDRAARRLPARVASRRSRGLADPWPGGLPRQSLPGASGGPTERVRRADFSYGPARLRGRTVARPPSLP